MFRVSSPSGTVDVSPFCWRWILELRQVEGENENWNETHTYGFEEGRSATEIFAMRFLAAVAREWGPEMGFVVCSLDVKQASDNVSPLNLNLVFKEMNIAPKLAGAILRE